MSRATFPSTMFPPDDDAAPRPAKSAFTFSKPATSKVSAKAVAPTPPEKPTPEKAPTPPDQTADKSKPRRVRLTLPFSPPLVERIKTLRASVGLTGDPVLELPLTAEFDVTDEARLTEALAAIGKASLPLTLTLPRVQAVVQGTQTYIAGWEIDNFAAIRQLYADLVKALSDLSNDKSPFKPPFETLLIVGERVPVKAFPALIAAMQRDFTPLTWQIDTVKADSPLTR